MPLDSDASSEDSHLLELFEQAIEQPEELRLDWARQACAGNDALCARLLRLLEADRDAGDPMAVAVHSGARLLDVADAARTGSRLGPWRIVGEIGHGGMGTVLEAERDDDEYRKRVAIKLIRGFPDRSRLARLRTERQILADLDHSNIAALIDGGSTDDGQPYLVMEFIDGEPIDRWCAGHGTPNRERVRLVIELVQAVHYAHQRLVVHRDIKPGNVLVSRDGVPKLLDFGIAKLVETAEPPDYQTKARYYTPSYSSPEQVGGRAVSTLSDVFSLGRLLDTVLRAGREDRPLPREPAAIVERATAARPEDRYPSAGALAADLQRYLDGYTVEALAKRRGYRLWRFVSRHRIAVGATALALAVGVWMLWQIVEESERARVAAANAEQTLAFLTGLIEAARPESAQGRDVTVAEVLENGEEQLTMVADSALRAGIAQTLAGAWHALEDFPRAAEQYTRAAAEAAAAGDRAGELRAQAKYLVVQTRAGLFRDDEVVAEAERVRMAVDRLPSAGSTLRADVLNDWSVWANDAGRAEEGRAALLEVVVLRRALDDEAELATSEHNLALAEHRLGNVAAALVMIERSVERKLRVLGPDHPSTLLGLRSLSIYARRAGDFKRSSEALATLLEQRIRLFGADNPALAYDYNEAGTVAHDTGDYMQAIDFYQHALELSARLDRLPNRHVYLNNLAAAHEDRGDFATAEALLHESLAIRQQRFGPDHASTLLAWHNLARLLLLQGRIDEAADIARDNLERYRDSLGPDHRNTLSAGLLAAWVNWTKAPQIEANFDTLLATAEQVLASENQAGLRALATHAVLARALQQISRLAEARVQFETAIDGYRQAFGPEHPKAAELELELARIDLQEGHARTAAERVSRVAPILNRVYAEPSPTLTLLGCLERAQTAADCD